MIAAAVLTRPPVGPVEPHVLYPLPDLQARTGLGAAAFRVMRREGLAVKYVGGRGYVLGREFIEHVAAHGKSEK